MCKGCFAQTFSTPIDLVYHNITLYMLYVIIFGIKIESYFKLKVQKIGQKDEHVNIGQNEMKPSRTKTQFTLYN